MKIYIIICLNVLFLYQCNIPHSNIKDKNKKDEHVKEQILEKTCTLRFQTFDEFRMEGIGEAKEQPAVIVIESKDRIIVHSTEGRDSSRVYERLEKDVWRSHMEYDIWKKDGYSVLKCEWDKPARTYDRLFFHDTICELETSYMGGSVIKTLIVKTKDNAAVAVNCDIDFSGSVSGIKKRVACVLKEKHFTTYKLNETKNGYSYISGKSTIEFPKKSYGLWGIQPGINETRLLNGQDIRNFSRQHPNGVVEDKDKIYELADIMPRYTGDIWSFTNQRNKHGNLHGRVCVDFVVEKDGSLSNITVSKSASAVLDKESVKLVSSMQKWTPAEINGVKVRCRMTIPIAY